MKKYLILGVLLLIVAIGALYAVNQKPLGERQCTSDSDCACGVNIKTGDCFFGNKNFVNVSVQCPDFCNGIAANLQIRCISNECKQMRV
jgi:hypothetical protein